MKFDTEIRGCYPWPHFLVTVYMSKSLGFFVTTPKILYLYSFYCQFCCVRISKCVRRTQTTKSLLFVSCDSEPDLNLKATKSPE